MEALRRVRLELVPLAAVCTCPEEFVAFCDLRRDLAEVVAGSDDDSILVASLKESLELDFLLLSFFSMLLAVPFAPTFVAPRDLLPLVRTGVAASGDDTEGAR